MAAAGRRVLTPARGPISPPSAQARLKAAVEMQGHPLPLVAHGALRLGAEDREYEQTTLASGVLAAMTGGGPGTGVGPAWHQLGPTRAGFQFNGGTYNGEDSGRLNDVRVSASNPDRAYIGASDGGIWRTDDLSAATPTWVPIGDNLPALAVGSFDVDPTDPNRIVAGLGDPFDTVSVGGAVTVSSDGGASWGAPVDLPGAVTVEDLRIDPSDPSRVLVAASNGLYLSTDGGLTFTPRTFDGLTAPSAWSLGYMGELDGISAWVVSTIDTTASATGRGRVWRSDDSGVTWNENTYLVTPGAGRIEFGVALAQDSQPASAVVYAQAANTNGNAQLGVWRSTDGGSYNWRPLGTTLLNPTKLTGSSGCRSAAVGLGQSYYNLAVAVDPTNPDNVLVGGQLCGVRSRDGGATWELVSFWLPAGGRNVTVNNRSLPYVHADWHAAAIATLPGGGVVSVAGTDGGIFVADDLFTAPNPEDVSWRGVNKGINDFLFYSVAGGDPSTSDADVVFSGAQDNGTRMRSVGANVPEGQFDQVIGGDGTGAAVVHPPSSYPVYWASVNNGGRRICQARPDNNSCDAPTDATGPWFQWGLAYCIRGETEPFITRYAAVPGGTDVLTASNFGVYRSRIPGNDINQGSDTQLYCAPSGVSLRNVEAAPFVSASGGKLYGVSVNGGRALIGIDNGTATTWRALATVDNPARKSGGNTRQISFAQTISFPHDARNVSPSASDGDVYVWGSIAPSLGDGTPVPAEDGHLYLTKDAGASFVTLHGDGTGHDLPNTPVYKVLFDPTDTSDRTLFAGTELGLYRSTDLGATWARYGVGLPNVSVRDFQIASDDSFIRIATFGRGLWQLEPPTDYPSSTTDLSADPTTVPAGVSTTLTATITPSDALGSVQFSDGATPLGSVPVVAGVATHSFASTTVASHQLTAAFIPNVKLKPSTGTVNVQVTRAVATAIHVAPANGRVAVGSTTSLSAGADFTDGTTRDVTTDATWSSDDSTVATVGASSGVVTGTGEGSTSIHAALDGKDGLASVSSGYVPAITSADSAGVDIGVPLSFTVTTTGTSPIALTETGALPAGLTFTDNGNGTATISGTPPAGSAGGYPLSITATNAFGSATHAFTLQVSLRKALVRLSPSNVHAVAITKTGSPAISLTARITDGSPAPYANISTALPATLALIPVAGGSSLSCTPTVTKTTAATATTPGSLDVACTFPAKGVGVNVYDVHLTVATSTFAGVNDSVLTVYDPASGGVSVGGTVLNPTTGLTGSVGVTVTRLKSGGVSGKYFYVESDTAGNQWIVKGNSIDTMAITTATSGRTSVITGKATYNGVGNYAFTLTALDATTDLYGQRITAPPGAASSAAVTFTARPISGAVVVN